MTDVIQFALLGIGLGAIYSMVALGVVVIYRGSGIVNFAQGAFALIGAVVFTELSKDGTAVWLALALAVLAGAATGFLTQALIMRRLRDSSPMVRVVATLGLLIAVQAAAGLHYGSSITTVPHIFSNSPLDVLGVTIPADRVIMAAIAIVLAVLLWAGQRFWLVGLATRAAAENEEAVSTLGWSPAGLALVNWTIGGALAGLAGALLVPLTGLVIASILLLIVPALAAALMGRFSAIGLTVLGAFGIGIAQSLVTRYWTQPGAAEALPFLIIIVFVALSGTALPLRSHIADRLPSLGSGLVRPRAAVAAVALGFVLMVFVFDTTWQDAFTVTLANAVVILSIVVLTGYAGQVSLAQMALAGLGAFVAGRLVAAEDWPFWAAFLAGVVTAVPLGVLFALPALRTRGITLAVLTLGMGVSVSAMLFNNVEYSGGLQGTDVGAISLFGFDINALEHPERYGVFVLVVFAAAALLVANLRRGPWGRRLIAIRENERAAASLGLSVTNAKLVAFTVAACLAAIGGILIAFRSSAIVYTDFNPFTSINAMVYAVIGGLGYVLGPLLGATLVGGGVASLFNGLISGLDDYLGLIGGVAVIAIVMLNPDGLAPAQVAQLKAAGKALARLPGLGWLGARSGETRRIPIEVPSAGGRPRTEPRPLVLRGLSVHYGGVKAVEQVDLEVGAGEVVGLIGANGAGKTTLIDAITGFAPIAAGSIQIGDVDITRASAHRRVREGIVRSWQSLEMFEDISVGENLLIASESMRLGGGRTLGSLIRPGRPALTPAAAAAVEEFELADDLHSLPGELSYGRRRLVGIARAVALAPSTILLDEPAAGLTQHESDELGAMITRFAKSWGMGVVLIEHYTDLVMAVSDRVAVMNFGRKIADGTPEQVRNDPAVIAAHLGPQATEVRA